MFVVEGHIIFARRLLLWATKGLSVSSHSLLMTINVSLLAPTGSPISLWATVERNINKNETDKDLSIDSHCLSLDDCYNPTRQSQSHLGHCYNKVGPSTVKFSLSVTVRRNLCNGSHFLTADWMSAENLAINSLCFSLGNCEKTVCPSTITVSLWAIFPRTPYNCWRTSSDSCQ